MKKFLFSLFLCSLVLILSRFSIPDMPFSIEGFPKDGPQPYVNLQKRAMIPLDSVDKVFYGGISYAVNGDEIHIWQRGFQQQTALKMAVGSNLLYKDELPPFQMDSHPTERDGVIYIPFRAVGEALEHNIFWKKIRNEAEASYYAAEIYVWNENEVYTPGSLRFSILQGSLHEKSPDEIYAGAVENFNRIAEQFSTVPSGKLRVVPLYRVNGYKIPEEVFFSEIYRKIDNSFWYPCNIESRCIDEIPSYFGKESTIDKWYSRQLYALREPILKNGTTETYRFTCLRSFHEPFSVRIEKAEDGGGILSFSMCDAPLHFSGGEFVKQEQKRISREQMVNLTELLEQKRFFRMPEETEEKHILLDGSDWIIESASNGAYHFVSRQSPKNTPVYDIGMFFLSLSEQSIDELY